MHRADGAVVAAVTDPPGAVATLLNPGHRSPVPSRHPHSRPLPPRWVGRTGYGRSSSPKGEDEHAPNGCHRRPARPARPAPLRKRGVGAATGRAPAVAMATMSAWEKRRCLPRNVHGTVRVVARRRSHDSRTASNSAASAGVYSGNNETTDGDPVNDSVVCPVVGPVVGAFVGTVPTTPGGDPATDTEGSRGATAGTSVDGGGGSSRLRC